MQSRRLAVIDVEADAAHAFRSMLEVLHGRTRCRWQLVDSIDEADVVVTGYARNGELPNLRQRPQSAGDQHVVAIVETSDARPPTPYVLSHPFRVMQVLTILNDLADEFLQQPETPRLRMQSNRTDAWEFAHSVRELAGAGSPDPWYWSRASDGNTIMVSGNLRSFACGTPLLDRVRDGTSVLGRLAPAMTQRVPLRSEQRPILDLLWHNAFHASDKLAPWLDGGGSFRVRRWPDFGAVAATRVRLQLVAAMSARACTRGDLARVVDAPRTEIDRVLNALSLCDLLVADSATAGHGQRTGSTATPGFLSAFIRSVRKSLHLER